MDKETTASVIRVSRQWWLKVNTKPFRAHALDGAVFPYIIKAAYTVDGQTYTKRKWIPAGKPVPAVGDPVTVLYDSQKPARAKIFL